MALSIVGAVIGVNILIWLYAVVVQLRIGREIYGGRYTESVPPTLAAYVLFLLVQVVMFPYFVLVGVDLPTSFIFSTQVLQILGGTFLVISLVKIYGIDFATTGFTEVGE